MINIKWDEKYSVGHERIDHEHQVFLDLIYNASLADEKGLAKERVLRLLEEVKKYASFHFFSEENIMLDVSYPGYTPHKEEHEILLASFEDQLINYRTDSCTLASIVDFMFEWFALHTTGSDRALACYIKTATPPVADH